MSIFFCFQDEPKPKDEEAEEEDDEEDLGYYDTYAEYWPSKCKL